MWSCCQSFGCAVNFKFCVCSGRACVCISEAPGSSLTCASVSSRWTSTYHRFCQLNSCVHWGKWLNASCPVWRQCSDSSWYLTKASLKVQDNWLKFCFKLIMAAIKQIFLTAGPDSCWKLSLLFSGPSVQQELPVRGFGAGAPSRGSAHTLPWPWCGTEVHETPRAKGASTSNTADWIIPLLWRKRPRELP